MMRRLNVIAGFIYLLIRYDFIFAQESTTTTRISDKLNAYSGFNITDFLLNRSFFDGSDYELTSSYAQLRGSGVIGWVHNFYTPSDLFELNVIFAADPLLPFNAREPVSLSIQKGIGSSSNPLGVTLFNGLGSQTGIQFSNHLTPASVPVNLFDAKEHSIRIIVNRTQDAKGNGEDIYVLSYVIDNKFKGKTKEEFGVISNFATSDAIVGRFIAPSIAYTNISRKNESSPSPTARILHWSFTPSQQKSLIADSKALDEYASYIVINGTKQYVRMTSHDSRNFRSNKGKIDNQISGHVTFREAPFNEAKCEAYFVLKFEDINNASHKVVEAGYERGDKRNTSLSATINYSVNENCLGSVIKEAGILSSVEDSGSVLVQNVVGFNGMRGKKIDFTNVSLQLADSRYVVSGCFFSFDRRDLVPLSSGNSPEISDQGPSLVTFCDGKYELQDEYPCPCPPNHDYSLATIICSKKDNPYCTVANVFNFMVSNIEYMAPASIRSITLPAQIWSVNGRRGSSTTSEPIAPALYFLTPNIDPTGLSVPPDDAEKISKPEQFRDKKEVVARRNQGARVCDCKETKLIGWDIEMIEKLGNIFDAFNPLTHFTVTRENPIFNKVYPERYTAVNYTLPGHALYPGKVTRQVVEENNVVIVRTRGMGSTTLYNSNLILGRILFGEIDDNLWLDFNTIANSPDLQKLIRDQPCQANGTTH